MNALATEVLAIYVQLDEARKQRLLDYVQQLLEKQRVHGAASRCGATPRGRERAGSQGLTSQHSDALYSRRRRASRGLSATLSLGAVPVAHPLVPRGRASPTQAQLATPGRDGRGLL